VSGAGCLLKNKTLEYTGRYLINALSGRGGSTRRLHQCKKISLILHRKEEDVDEGRI